MVWKQLWLRSKLITKLPFSELSKHSKVMWKPQFTLSFGYCDQITQVPLQ